MRLTVIDKTVRPVKSSHRATRIGERVFMVKVNHYLCTNVGLADVFVHQQACLAAVTPDSRPLRKISNLRTQGV